MKKLNVKLEELLKKAESEVTFNKDELTNLEKSQIKGGTDPTDPCWCESHKVFRD